MNTAVQAANNINMIVGAVAQEAGDITDDIIIAVDQRVQDAIQIGLNSAQEAEITVQQAILALDTLIEAGQDGLGPVREVLGEILSEVRVRVAMAIEAIGPLVPCVVAGSAIGGAIG